MARRDKAVEQQPTYAGTRTARTTKLIKDSLSTSKINVASSSGVYFTAASRVSYDGGSGHLSKGANHSAPDSLNTNALTPLPDHRGGAEASLKFQDWVEITSTAMTDVSGKSGQWWKAVMLVAEAAYSRWLSATRNWSGPQSPARLATLVGQVKGYHRHLQAELEGILGQSPKGNKMKDKSQEPCDPEPDSFGQRKLTRENEGRAEGAEREGHTNLFHGFLINSSVGQRSNTLPPERLRHEGMVHSGRGGGAVGGGQRFEDAIELRGITLDATTGTDFIDYYHEGTYHIVPLGELVRTLGYSLEWSQKGCFLMDAEGNSQSLGEKGAAGECHGDVPRLPRQLTEYVTKGTQEAGLRAVRDAPFLADLPGACVDGMVQSGVMESGWQVLKEIEFLTRSQRTRLWSAKRLIIHLFAGDPGHYELFQLDEGDTVVLELDIQRCKAHDILRTSTWRLLMWAAMSGKIDVIMAGPPGRGGLCQGTGGRCDVKGMTLLVRTLWLYAVAEEELAEDGSCIPNAYLSWLPCLKIDGGNMWKEGTMGRNLKYLMIARYNLPVEYVKGYTARGQGKDQSSEDADFIGGTRRQQAEYQDYDDSMYEPSEPEEPPKELQEDLIQRPGDPDPHQDCVAPASTYLLFAKALPSNGSTVVKAAMQDVILYLQAHGLPIYRLHADKGETYNHSVRTWLRDQGIRATWSEPGIPQGNGQAEGAVRWIKDKRARVLGWKSKLLAPFGAVVHVKQKAFDSSGPRRRERAFESKWIRGRYVGLSSILDNGHVVYIPDEQGTREKFIHTFHVRPRLIDPGLPQQELIADDPPRPRRRIEGKTPMAHVQMKELQLSEEEFGEYIRDRSRTLLDEWNQEVAINLIDELAECKLFDEVKFGVFRHGGVVGRMRGFTEHPELAKVLSKMILYDQPEATFTAIMVARNMERGMHQDLNNDDGAMNYVLPVRLPEKGGELWVEVGKGDKVQEEIVVRQDDQGRQRYGQLFPL
ncbi:unnamed protein product, partial [Symbiodinium sp. CCMP2456]